MQASQFEEACTPRPLLQAYTYTLGHHFLGLITLGSCIQQQGTGATSQPAEIIQTS